MSRMKTDLRGKTFAEILHINNSILFGLEAATFRLWLNTSIILGCFVITFYSNMMYNPLVKGIFLCISCICFLNLLYHAIVKAKFYLCPPEFLITREQRNMLSKYTRVIPCFVTPIQEIKSEDCFNFSISSFRSDLTPETSNFSQSHIRLDNADFSTDRETSFQKSLVVRTRDAEEYACQLRNRKYQLSTSWSPEKSPSISETTSVADTNICKVTSTVNDEFDVDPSHLLTWVTNLRKWITKTILTKLLDEIKAVNYALTLQGMSNIIVGSATLEQLQKMAHMPHIAQSIPSLPTLISFLSISPNQAYVVQRITDLSKGGYMGEYNWSGGGSLNGRPWNEQFPTDAAFVAHLIAAYLDSQLLPIPMASANGKQFSSVHLTQMPQKPSDQVSVAIYQSRINPPHFQLVANKKYYDISEGRNNLFHVVLFFLQYVKLRHGGMFEFVNLSSSGLNMLNIISKP